MYQFTDDCLTGVMEIDEEHRKLFELIDGAYELAKGDFTKAGLEVLLDELKEYAKTHFAHEEAYMERIGDGELERQKREHAQFAAKVASYDLAGSTEEASGQVVAEILSYMAKWLYSHILGSDIMIGKFPGKGKRAEAFVFTDKYRTGIPLIDDEHKELFRIVRKANELIWDEMCYDKYDMIVHILAELKDYTIMHFQDEERYMEKIHYEGLEMQRRAHATFVERLEEVDLEDVDDNQQEYLVDLVDFLLGWLINHILKMDKQIPVNR